MRTLNLQGVNLTPAELLGVIPRVEVDTTAVLAATSLLVADVQHQGEKALREQAFKFDLVEQHTIRVPHTHLEEAYSQLNPELRDAIHVSIERVENASRAQIPPTHVTHFAAGGSVIQRWQPMERAGVYIPGGKAVYPSSVIMNVVPAQIAQVAQIALVSPPQAQHGGRIHPTILAVAHMLGVTEIYAMGGAGAIAALAYGVPEIGLKPVNVITGPGNAFVSAAKSLVKSIVGIDSEAGPTEILIIADDGANPAYIAADLISQAEHDEQASAILVTDSSSLIDRVQVELERQSQTTEHSERVATALSGPQSCLILVDDIDEAIAFSNAYAPEHLEIHTKNAELHSQKTINAGAIFLGEYSPVSLGDYSAGSNHVLPTVGHAKFSSGLGAHTFLRSQQIVDYNKEALAEVSSGIRLLSNDELLPAHGDAVDIRFTSEEN